MFLYISKKYPKFQYLNGKTAESSIALHDICMG
jgi:hypothetical protein